MSTDPFDEFTCPYCGCLPQSTRGRAKHCHDPCHPAARAGTPTPGSELAQNEPNPLIPLTEPLGANCPTPGNNHSTPSDLETDRLRAEVAALRAAMEKLRAVAIKIAADYRNERNEARAALAEATQTERERCHRIAETTHCAAIGPGSGCCSWRAAHDAIAAAIRGTK